jgi:hypothetical protein
MKSGNLNFLEPSGPLQACNVTALPLQTCADNHKEFNILCMNRSNRRHWPQGRECVMRVWRLLRCSGYLSRIMQPEGSVLFAHEAYPEQVAPELYHLLLCFPSIPFPLGIPTDAIYTYIASLRAYYVPRSYVVGSYTSPCFTIFAVLSICCPQHSFLGQLQPVFLA